MNFKVLIYSFSYGFNSPFVIALEISTLAILDVLFRLLASLLLEMEWMLKRCQPS